MNELELLTNFDKRCYNAEILASITIHTIQMPLCSSLMQLTSTDCINILKYGLGQWPHVNQPSKDRLLLYYFIIDYINCGLSSPIYHTVFHKNLHSNKSKIKLLKNLITIWDTLFKHYTITSLNVEFSKHLVVGLEHQFFKLSTFVPNYQNTFQCNINTVINNIKYGIKMFEKNILNTQVLCTLNNDNMKLYMSNKKVPNIKNKIPKQSDKSKVFLAIQNLTNQNKSNIKNKKHTTLNKGKQNFNLENQKSYIDQYSKKPKLISNYEQDVLHMNIKSNTIHILPPEKKLNAFQIMMNNAKNRTMGLK